MSVRRPDRPSPRRAAATLAAVGVWPLVVLACAAAVDLPKGLAVRWNAVAPDTFVSTAWLTTAAVGTGVVAAAVVAVALVTPGPSYLGRRFAVGVTATAAAAAAGGWGLLAATAATAPDPAAPPPPSAVLVLLPLVAVLVATSLAGLAYGHPPVDPAPGPPATGLPRAELPTGAQPHWTYEGVSGFFVSCIVVLLVIGTVLFRIVLVGALLCWVMALLTLVLVRLRFDIDERGLSFRAWGRRPAGTLPWDRVVEAHAVRVRIVQWGGWGFRLIPARPVVGLRKGPALVLTLTDGRRLGVTLDDPVLPAGLVNTHLDRLRAPLTRGGSDLVPPAR